MDIVSTDFDTRVGERVISVAKEKGVGAGRTNVGVGGVVVEQHKA